MGLEYIRETSVRGSAPNMGTVWLYDPMSDKFVWSASGHGTPSCAASAADCYIGTKSLLLTGDAGSPAEDEFTMARRQFCPRPFHAVSVELFFNPTSTEYKKYTDFFCFLDDLSYLMLFGIRFVFSTSKWQTFAPGDTFEDIPGAVCALEDDNWFYLRFVVDIDTRKYISFSLNSLFFDISSLSFEATASGDTLYSDISARFTNAGADQTELKVDSVLISNAQL